MSETPQETLEKWLALENESVEDHYRNLSRLREAIRAVLGDLVEAEQTSRADEERIAHLEAERDALREQLEQARIDRPRCSGPGRGEVMSGPLRVKVGAVMSLLGTAMMVVVIVGGAFRLNFWLGVLAVGFLLSALGIPLAGKE